MEWTLLCVWQVSEGNRNGLGRGVEERCAVPKGATDSWPRPNNWVPWLAAHQGHSQRWDWVVGYRQVFSLTLVNTGNRALSTVHSLLSCFYLFLVPSGSCYIYCPYNSSHCQLPVIHRLAQAAIIIPLVVEWYVLLVDVDSLTCCESPINVWIWDS